MTGFTNVALKAIINRLSLNEPIVVFLIASTIPFEV